MYVLVAVEGSELVNSAMSVVVEVSFLRHQIQVVLAKVSWLEDVPMTKVVLFAAFYPFLQ